MGEQVEWSPEARTSHERKASQYLKKTSPMED